ncbi:hypothetical protein ICN84_01590 [Akkermansia glycaniphila]|uniref:hypothetical protein n=1 Tax=Akkermansia glycaniphila TaxID=1679444 RepID=UPI001C022A78|nr:hypothetical protein [Akkermansia glycaniphila]MBT9448763.1 hypothetical protein [Akkermansia glycaniphila]
MIPHAFNPMGTGGERLWVRPNLTAAEMTSAQKLAVGLNDQIAWIGHQAADFFVYETNYQTERYGNYKNIADGNKHSWSNNWVGLNQKNCIKRKFGCTHPLKITQLSFELRNAGGDAGTIPPEVRLYGTNKNPALPEILLATYLIANTTGASAPVYLQVENPDWYQYYGIWASNNISINELNFIAYTRS